MTLIEFLNKHAIVFCMLQNYLACNYYNVSAWLIPAQMVGELEKFGDDEICKGVSHGRVFYTTNYGLIYPMTESISSQPTSSFQGGYYRTLYPQVIEQLLADKAYLQHTPKYMQNNILSHTRETVDAYFVQVQLKKEIQKQEAEQQALERKQRKEEFTALCLNGKTVNEEITKLIDQAWYFDVHYHYSDDASVWRNGKTREEKILAEFEALGLNVSAFKIRLSVNN